MHQISFWFNERGLTPEREINRTRKKGVSAIFLACTVRDEWTQASTHARRDARTHGQPETNMPHQPLRSWGHKKLEGVFIIEKAFFKLNMIVWISGSFSGSSWDLWTGTLDLGWCWGYKKQVTNINYWYKHGQLHNKRYWLYKPKFNIQISKSCNTASGRALIPSIYNWISDCIFNCKLLIFPTYKCEP